MFLHDYFPVSYFPGDYFPELGGVIITGAFSGLVQILPFFGGASAIEPGHNGTVNTISSLNAVTNLEPV